MIEILLLIFFAIGIFLIGLFSISAILPNPGTFQKILYAFPLGIGIITIVFYSLNTLLKFKLTSYSVWAVLFVILIIAFAIFHTLKKRNYSLKPGYFTNSFRSFKSLSPSYKLIALSLGILLIVMLIHAIIVPVYKHDAFLYHLPIAKETFLTGYFPEQISASYLEFERAYPPLGYFSYALFYLAQGKENLLIVKLLPFAYGILLLGIVYHLTRFILKRSIEASIIAMVLVLASYYFSNMAIFENTDIYTGFYYAAAASLLLQFFQSYKPSYFYVAVIMAGLSYWTKYTGLVWIASFFIISVFLYLRAGHKRAKMNKWLLTGAILGFLLIFPHLLNNYMITGNPIFPLFDSAIGRSDPWYQENVLSVIMSRQMPQIPFDLLFRHGVLIFPLLISWIIYSKKNFPEKFIFSVSAISLLFWILFFQGDSILAPNTYLYLVGPYILLCAVASQTFTNFLSKKPLRISRGISLAYFAFLLFLAVSFFAHGLYGNIGYTRVPEYILAMAVLAILFLYPFVHLKKDFALAQFGVVIVMLLPFILSLAVYPLKFAGTGELGKDIAYSYYEPSYSWMKNNLSPDDLILTFHGRLYLLTADYIPVDSPKIIEAYQTESLDRAVKILSENGITYIFISEHSREIPLFGKSIIFQNLDSNYFTEVFSENESELKVSIYRINYNMD
ncbi:glycosyltransferase family 39 protein [Candidatus Woesearchaeota archaeon]|nr:glycosyltransferase family 39 protein [Candidatus Woesearchaeota archaeon]